MIDLGLRMLLHDKLRFLITVAGVAFAVTLVLTQVGLFIGMLDNASVTIEHLGADLWVTSRNTPNVDFSHEFSESLVDRVRSIPSVQRADNLIVQFMNLALPTGAQEGTLVYAMEDFAAWGFPWNVESGDVRDLRRGPSMMLDASAVRRYGTFKVGEYRELVGRRLKIIGVTRDARSFTTTPISFLDYRLAQSLSPSVLAGQTSYILVKLAPKADASAVRQEIRRRLPHNDVYTGAEWARASRRYWVKSTGIGFSMLVTVFLGALVGVVVVAQTLYTSTMEHLKEFGTVKAMGGTNSDIYRILGRQAMVAAVVGFLLGVIPSFMANPLVALADLRIHIPIWVTTVVFVGTVAMCLAAAAVSFRKVANIDPALVFRG